MNILVTGGTGFLGSRLVKALQKKGHKVIVFSRDSNSIADEVIVGDIIDDIKKLKDVDFKVVYHLAGELDESSGDLQRVNVDGTRALLEICKDKAIDRFIFASTIGVLGASKTTLKEDDPYNPKTGYEKSKAEAERVVTDSFLKWQLPYTIIRMTIIVGANETWKQIFKAAKNKYPLIGEGANYWHLLYVDDAIQALMLATNPRAKNQIYNIAGPKALTYLETYKLLASVLKTRLSQKRIHPLMAKAAALAHEAQSKAIGKKPKVFMMRASIERLIRNRRIDISKARADLGFAPKYSVKKGFEKTLKELGKL